MNKMLRSILLLILIPGFLFAQKRLTASRVSGYYTHVYKLTDNETYAIALGSTKVINDSFMHTPVDSFLVEQYNIQKKLPYGNYLYVRPEGNKLDYKVVPVTNTYVHFAGNGNDFRCAVTDLNGKLVSDAEVLIGRRSKAAFDPESQLYIAGHTSKRTVVTVRYQGCSNYFMYNIEPKYKRAKRPSFFRRLFAKKTNQQKKDPKREKTNKYLNRYKGYMVLNKPKFKPLDTVKFKAYLVTAKGLAISGKQMRVKLTGPLFNNHYKDILLDTIKPYREGGYAFDFVLADSLRLRLDAQYRITLEEKTGKDWIAAISKGFRYEDYELKSITFNARSEKKDHKRGEPLVIYLKATDENDLAVADGKVNILIKANNVRQYRHDKVFVKDTLWSNMVIMDPVGETKVVVPDSIFPKADISAEFYLKFSNSNNETRDRYLYINHQEDNRAITWKYQNDSLHLDYQTGGDPVRKKAIIYTVLSSENHLDRIDSAAIDLPAAIKLDPRAFSYDIKTADGYQQTISISEIGPAITPSAIHSKDSLRFVVVNKNLIPFWYTLFSGERVIARGYTDHLDTILKHNPGKAGHLLINYLWAGHMRSQETSAAYFAKQLRVKLIAPDMVYPGQTVNMLVKVSDPEERPVPATDVTAFAFTTKFQQPAEVMLPSFNKAFFGRKTKPELEHRSLIDQSGQIRLNWDKWGRALHLDTIEYYKFTQTKDLYQIEEAGKEYQAVIAPFVVKNGAIEPIHVVYIDGIPVYFSQASQLKRYAFALNPGFHYIKLRTANYLVTLEGQEFTPNRKTIISVAADSMNKKATVKPVPAELSPEEASDLDKYMIRITDNFEGKRTRISAAEHEVLLNPPPAVMQNNKELLIGPFKENRLFFQSGSIDRSFVKEPGYTYTFKSDLLKQKSFSSKYAFDPKLSISGGSTNYAEYPLQSGEIDSIWNEYLDLRSRTTNLFYNGYYQSTRLNMYLDTAVTNKNPYVKNIIIYNPEAPDFIHIYPGQEQTGFFLPKGTYQVLYLLKDNSYFIKDQVRVLPYGINYYLWKAAKINPPDTIMESIDQKIKSVRQVYGASLNPEIREQIIELLNEKHFKSLSFTRKVSGRVIDGTTMKALAGVAVRIKGLQRVLGVTDKNGKFSALVPERCLLTFTAAGYDKVELSPDSNLTTVRLMEARGLDEVVIRGYQKRSREQTTGSSFIVTGKEVSNVQIVPGASPGLRGSVNIRGLASADKDFPKNPLIFLDGLPYSGDMKALDQDMIAEITILKDADATAIYGSRGANGVILIKSKKGNLQTNAAGETISVQQSLRRNFSDYAIWQPKLLTDARGTAAFSVKFPDDITSWDTKAIAMNGHGQTGQSQMTIKSFKSLSANFVSPQFAVEGDQFSVIGKLMNYTNMEEKATRKLSYNGKEILNSLVSYKNAHIDTVQVQASHLKDLLPDSLSFEYTMTQDNGYFDGEQRKIPLMPVGVKETKGYFDVLSGDTVINYDFDPTLGKVTLNAEASVFPVLLSEIEKLRNYEYLCNEQLASKLKVLLLEKKIRTYLGEEFKWEKNIKEIIRKLQDNRRPEGTWGWWPGSNEEMWISLHVVEALLQAGQSGYPVSLNKDQTYRYLLGRLADQKDINQLHLVKLLYALDSKYYIKDWLEQVEKKAEREEKLRTAQRKINPRIPEYHQPLYDKLQLMLLKQKAGMPVDIEWLLKQKKSTMFGNSYWGEPGRYFWGNSIQNTLLAYQILKATGTYRTELDKIARYFLEQRKDGQWRNTYESSLILETILPELITDGKKPEPPGIVLNDTEAIKTFPFSKTLEPGKLSLSKKGNAPVYFTAYQQFHNPNPEKVSKDFTVRSSFMQNNKEVKSLKGGTTAYLKVEVEARADADYVMIEIPVPAGCSYENKPQSYWGVETHREYFKHKTSIFCTKLKQGKYTFNIQLMPRYSGNYNFNPAKAEMMYFPVFYGREGMKKITVN